MLKFRSAPELLGFWPGDTKTLSRYSQRRTSWTRVEPRQTKSGFGLDLLGGKSESATAGSFDANEDIKQTRYSDRVCRPFWKGYFMKCRREWKEGGKSKRRRERNLEGNMKIASGSATWNPEATSHTLAVLSLPLPAGLRSTRVPRTVGAPSQTLLWGLAVGGGDRGEERACQAADWMHENIPGALAGRTRNLGGQCGRPNRPCE